MDWLKKAWGWIQGQDGMVASIGFGAASSIGNYFVAKEQAKEERKTLEQKLALEERLKSRKAPSQGVNDNYGSHIAGGKGLLSGEYYNPYKNQ